MGSREPIAVCVVGPKGAGKSCLVNSLAELPAPSSYVPTAGVRVQEVERPSRVRAGVARVRLWDCEGGAEAQACWPALAHGCQGLLLVYDPEQAGAEQQLEALYRAFAQPRGLREKQCAVVAVAGSPQGRAAAGLQGKLRQLHHCVVDAEALARAARCEAALECVDRIVQAAG